MRNNCVFINPKVFGDRLRKAMGKRKMTCFELAQNTDHIYQSVCNWRYGVSIPSFDTICAIADTLNVSLDYLAGRKENMEI